MKTTYSFKAKVWIYPGDTAWYFVNVPKTEAEAIRKNFGHASRGWGSLPVEVTLGKIKWKTSIFRDKKSASYLLPLKASVRESTDTREGDVISLKIEVII